VKPDYRKSRIRRIILLYAAGVVIPGIVLGYMAFRGIQNDQAIREKESRNRMEHVRESFFKALDSTLYADFQKAFTKSGPSAKSAGDRYFKAALAIPVVGPARLISHQLLYLPLEFADTMQ
jgi:hypothetical protein